VGLIKQRLLNGKGKLFVEHPSKEARKLHKMIGIFGGYWIDMQEVCTSLKITPFDFS
jgi:hypothetical protein